MMPSGIVLYGRGKSWSRYFGLSLLMYIFRIWWYRLTANVPYFILFMESTLTTVHSSGKEAANSRRNFILPKR